MRFALLISLFLSSPAAAIEPDVPPREEKPVRVPAAPLPPADEAGRDALARYGLGFLRSRDDRLVEASKQYRAAAEQDPKAVAPLRELVKVYTELGRDAAAIRTAREVLARDPDDGETAQRLGRLLMDGKKYADAAKAFAQAAKSQLGKDDPVARIVLLREWDTAAEKAGDSASHEKAARELLTLLAANKPLLLKSGAFTSEEFERARARGFESLGNALAGSGKFDSATAALETARDLYADPKGANDRSGVVRLHWNLSNSLARAGEPADALNQLELFLAERPTGFAPYERWIELMNASKRKDGVPDRLALLAQRNPTNPAPQWLAAAAKLQTDPRTGDPAFRALANSGDKPEYFRVLVKAYATAGLAKEFLELADSLFAAARPKDFFVIHKPGEPEPPPSPSPKAADVQRARLFNEAAKAETGFTEALVRQLDANIRAGAAPNPDTLELLMALASRDRLLPEFTAALQGTKDNANFRLSSLLIECLRVQRRWAEIIRTADRLKELDGNRISLTIASQVAIAYAELGMEAKAMAAIEQINGRLYVRVQKAQLYNILGKHREALKELEEILKLDKPKGGDLRMVRIPLIGTLHHLKEDIRAETLMREMLDDDPDDVLILNNFGYHLAEQGRKLDEAETMIRRAMELDRDAKIKVGDPDAESGNYLDSLGWVLFKRGKYAAAQKALEDATKFAEVSENGVVWDHLGDVYFRTEQLKRAAAAYERASKLFANSHEGRQQGRSDEVKRKLKLLK